MEFSSSPCFSKAYFNHSTHFICTNVSYGDNICIDASHGKESFLILKKIISLGKIKENFGNFLWEALLQPEYIDTILHNIFSWKITQKWNTEMLTHGWLPEKQCFSVTMWCSLSLGFIFQGRILVMKVKLQGAESHSEAGWSQRSNNFVFLHFGYFLAVRLMLSSVNLDTGQPENLHEK